MIDMIAIGHSAVRTTSWVLGGLVRGPNTFRSSEESAETTIRTVHRRGARAGQAGQKVSVGGKAPLSR
jgi:hypothetical protein